MENVCLSCRGCGRPLPPGCVSDRCGECLQSADVFRRIVAGDANAKKYAR